MTAAPCKHGLCRGFGERSTMQPGLSLPPATSQDKPFAFKFLKVSGTRWIGLRGVL